MLNSREKRTSSNRETTETLMTYKQKRNWGLRHWTLMTVNTKERAFNHMWNKQGFRYNESPVVELLTGRNGPSNYTGNTLNWQRISSTVNRKTINTTGRVPKFPSTNVTSFHSVTLTLEAKPPGSKENNSLQRTC